MNRASVAGRSPDALVTGTRMRPLRHPEQLSPALRVRRGVLLVLLTLVVPGSAQLVAGSRRMGRAAVRVWLAVLVGVLLLGALYLLDRSLLLTLFTRPFSLLVLLVLLVAGGLWWAYLFFDAWRLASLRRLLPRPGAAVGVLAAVLALATAGPMLYGAQLVGAQRDLIDSVFGSGTRSEAVDGRYNVLLLGGDAGDGRVGIRPDSITLASIDADTGSTVLFGLPRNLQEVPFPEGTPAATAMPEGFSCGDECLLNALYSYGTENPEQFPGGPDPGIVAMKQAVEGVTGLKVNYDVLVELDGFEQIIDAMGGIEMDVGRRVPIGGGTSPVSGYIEPGSQTLDGFDALWFARSREGSSDYERMARQRCVMSAMVTQMDPQTLLTRFQQIAAASSEVVSTDLPDEDLGTFVDLGLKAKSQKITSVQFVPPLIEPANPDFDVIRAAVTDAIAADGQTEAEAPAEPPAGEPDDPPPAEGSGPAGPTEPDPERDGTDEDSTTGDAGEPVDARAVCQAG